MKIPIIRTLTRLLFVVSLFNSLASAQTAGNWDQFGFAPGGGRDNTFETLITSLNVSTLGKVWGITGNNAVQYGVSLAVHGGIAYVGCTHNGAASLCALDAATGAVRWSFTNGFGGPGSSATFANGLVYAWFPNTFNGTTGTLYALNASTGVARWSLNTNGKILSSVTVANGFLYFGLVFGSQAGTVYSVNATNGTISWSFTTGGAIWSAPAVATNGTGLDQVFVSSADHNLYILSDFPGQPVAHTSVALAGVPTSPVVVTVNRIESLYVTAGTQAYAYLLDIDGNPSLAWEVFNSNSWGTCAVDTSTETLFCPDGGGSMYALGPDGQQLWKFTPSGTAAGLGTPALADHVLYFGAQSQYFYALANNGTQLWRYNFGPNTTTGIPTVVNGFVYETSITNNGTAIESLFAFTP